MTCFTSLLNEEIFSSVLMSLCQDLGILPSVFMTDGIPDHDTAKERLKAAAQQDITACLVSPDATTTGKVITKEPCVFVGKQWVEYCFSLLHEDITITWHTEDGQSHEANETLFALSGNTRAILTGERSALNFAQTLSATATAVRHYAALLSGSNTHILDTRKTLPGLRYAQKYAVQCGGGQNHRIGLYDRFLIKENHILGCGSIAAAIATAKAKSSQKLIEVEVESLDELQQAIEAQADIVMLDNFSNEMIQQAVHLAAKRVKLEVSGNIEESHLKDLSEIGVDYISSGAITKHVKAIDLSLRLD